MSKSRLLIDDDDPELRGFLATELGVEGCGCEQAGTAREALGLIRGQSWDLVLLDPGSREVTRAGEPIHLTAREFELLLHLFRQPGVVQERRSILKALWGEDWMGDDNLLDVYVRYLRRKLEPPGRPTLIQTVRGVGFMLKEGPTRG
jgi:DNA-binding response OmpR family regulator